MYSDPESEPESIRNPGSELESEKHHHDSVPMANSFLSLKAWAAAGFPFRGSQAPKGPGRLTGARGKVSTLKNGKLGGFGTIIFEKGPKF